MSEITIGGAAAPEDDWLDSALRAQRPRPLADDGFAARVMAALPAPAVAMAPSWRKPVVATLWTLAVIGIALALPGMVPDLVRDLVHDGYRVFTAYPVSLPQLAFAIAAAAAVMWTATGYAVKSQLSLDG